MPSSERSDAPVLERGNIYFFYRPKVEQHEPEGVSDLQNLHLVLSPHGKQLLRLLIVGRERMPDPGEKGKQRHWAFVDAVYDDPKRR